MPRINLIVAWLWVMIGFLWGFGLGLFFHQEQWLGGYGALKRRLYRLAHISFFGLGLINLAFYFTAQTFSEFNGAATVASIGFVVGAAAMPACCVIMAHFPKRRELFVIPVLSLVIAAGCTLWEVWSK